MDPIKQKGINLLNDGCALGDVSGRTREVNEKSTLGLASKNFAFSVLFLSSDKIKVSRKLFKKYGEKRGKIILHAVKIHYAIKNYIDTCPAFYICADGSDQGTLKHYLRQYLANRYHEQKIKILPSLIPLFGKENLAHNLASEVNKRIKKPTILLKERHFQKLSII